MKNYTVVFTDSYAGEIVISIHNILAVSPDRAIEIGAEKLRGRLWPRIALPPITWDKSAFEDEADLSIHDPSSTELIHDRLTTLERAVSILHFNFSKLFEHPNGDPSDVTKPS